MTIRIDLGEGFVMEKGITHFEFYAGGVLRVDFLDGNTSTQKYLPCGKWNSVEVVVALKQKEPTNEG